MELRTERQVFQEVLTVFYRLIGSDLLLLLTKYSEPIMNDSALPPQVYEAADVVFSKTSVFSKEQLILLLAREWERLHYRWFTVKLQGDTLLQRDLAFWPITGEIKCPFCGVPLMLPEQDKQRIECYQCDNAFDRDLLDVYYSQPSPSDDQPGV